ncbi:OmpA family protein [Campylobacter sp. faydin G-24]|uniref:OmpA family protein n=1 Tax=Campylobacter anatolicus TaxID=2829105 RepID=A0ABS5HJ25_9BACT|nr:flagellar motor protein MotB [Campylobacter anatolicus]MBR8462939.1 OmpA family protein [Campylobacter anatolicus]MBR8464015.1 OmpA family protein [Campylobacter anatolicus]MBR8465797.1 OmpA family protein [Campylobacter anatolicus]
MANKIDPADCPKCMPQWLATFGDLMSLLLCFFVLLLSMATMDAKKMEAAAGSLAGALSVLDGGAKPDTQVEQETELQNKIKKSQGKVNNQSEMGNIVKTINELTRSSGSPEVTIQESEDGFIVRLPASLLFESGKANIQSDDVRLFLKRIAMVAAKMPSDVKVNVIGHTDNQKPDINSLYKDNWQLSTARAISVVQELLEDGVSADRLIASGRAAYEPFASNDTAEGKERNNRVDIHFVSLDKKAKEATKKSVLDAVK